MKYKKTLKILIIISLAATVLYILIGLKKKSQPEFSGELKVDGETMVHNTYDKEHRKAMELKCTEAINESEDKTDMKNIEGVIYKKGRMNKDISVSGKSGYVANNSQNFFIEGDAKVASEDFSLKGPSFLLEGQAEMSTEKKVDYKAKDLQGIATNGIKYYLKLNILKLFNTRGRYKRDNRDFDFTTDVLWVLDKDKMIVMENNTVIREANSILRSGWMSLKFTGNFVHISEATSQKGSYFYLEDRDKQEIKEIKSDNISSYYNDAGKLSRVLVMQKGEILLKSKTDHMMINSDKIEMFFDPESGKATRIDIPAPGQVENTGKTKFRVAADTISAVYNKKGELSTCEGKGKTIFIIDEYHGTGERLFYDIARDSMTMSGPNAQVVNGENNTFNSSKFNVDTRQKILSSSDGVKSTILLKKKNVLFSEAPMFLNAKEFRILEKKNKFRYDTRVQLMQDDISLTADTLEITEENQIEASGKVSLSFKNREGDSGAKDIAIKADNIVFNARERNIEIAGNGAIKSGETLLKANRLVVQFSDANEITDISGEGNIEFLKEDLSGTSGKVQWLFAKEMMILKDSPRVAKKTGGATSGKELEIDLKTNTIKILSSASERSETIIQ
ncbi:MAG: LPS export ABC transporter periplasmic protein LptC [Candidatus Aminicenantes bacterium]|nr:LPS export ABC transporter periplasmic protein LptC [Candidatus Aminicenantes bacterium]